MTTVTLPLRTVSEANQRDHWFVRAKRAKKQRRTAWALCPAVGLPVVVTMVRVGLGRLDDDNLRGALKAVRDGIADRLGVPDNDHRIEWRYGQRRGPYAVEITFDPPEAAP